MCYRQHISYWININHSGFWYGHVYGEREKERDKGRERERVPCVCIACCMYKFVAAGETEERPAGAFVCELGFRLTPSASIFSWTKLPNNISHKSQKARN